MKRHTLPWIMATLLGLVVSETRAIAVEIKPTTWSLQREQLSNGLQVWYQPRQDTQSVFAMLVVKVGSRHETEENNGISHFVEHMLFTGTERWPTEKDVKQVIDERGGTWNGMTSEESTIYFAHVSSQDTQIALEWLAQVVFHPTFPEGVIDKERQVVFQEKGGQYGWLTSMLDRMSDRWGLGYRLNQRILKTLFPADGFGLYPIGTDQALNGIDRQDLMKYYQSYYVPSNSILIVVGQVNPKTLRSEIQAQFGNLPKADPPPPRIPPKPLKKPIPEVIVRGPLVTDQVRIEIGARTVEPTHPDRWGLEVLAEMASQELEEKIRLDQGLTYTVFSRNNSFTDSGYFSIWMRSDRKNQQKITQEIHAYLDKMINGQIDAKRLEIAKSALIGKWSLGMESNPKRAFWLEDWSLHRGAGQNFIPDYPTAIASITPEEVKRIAQTYLTSDNRFIALHIPILTVKKGVIITSILFLVIASLLIWKFKWYIKLLPFFHKLKIN